MIDMRIPCDHNISAQEFDKLKKYKYLLIGIEKMLYPKTQ